MDGCTAFLTHFDLFGNSFTPTVSNSTKRNTNVGGFFGIIYILFCLFLSIISLTNLISRDNPNVVFYTNNTATSEAPFRMLFGFRYYINAYPVPGRTEETKIKDLTFLSNFTNIDRLLTSELAYGYFNNEISVPIIDCKSYVFADKLEDTDNQLFQNSKCVDTNSVNITLLQNVTFSSQKNLKLNIYECVNSSAYNNCLSESDQNYYFSNYEIMPFFIYSEYRFKPQSFKDPFNYFLTFFYTKIINSHDLTPTYFLELERVRLDTDEGYFMEDISSNYTTVLNFKHYLVGSVIKEYNKDGIFRKKLVQLIFSVSKNYNTITRTYIKIMEVVANVTGTSGLVAFIFQFILQNVYDSMTKELIIHQIFKLNEEIINENENKNPDRKSFLSKVLKDVRESPKDNINSNKNNNSDIISNKEDQQNNTENDKVTIKNKLLQEEEIEYIAIQGKRLNSKENLDNIKEANVVRNVSNKVGSNLNYTEKGEINDNNNEQASSNRGFRDKIFYEFYR